MNEEKEFLEKMARMDFDPHQQAQRRVWNRLHRQALSRPFIKPLAWGLCAGVLLMLGGLAGIRFSAYLQGQPHPQKNSFLQNAQCKKADGSILFSTQLECRGADCSCTKTMIVCDEHPVTRITRKNCKTAPSDFDPQDPWNLWGEDSQKQIKDLAFCQNQC